MILLDNMPNQEHEHEEIANIASTLVGLASFATLHRSGVQTTGSATAVETISNVQQEALATASATNGRLDTVGAVPAARIEAQPRRKLPFVSKASLKSSNGDAKERKSDVPKTNGAAPVSVLTASQLNAQQDHSTKEVSIPNPGHFLSAKERNGGKEAKAKKQAAKNRSSHQLGTSGLPPSTTPVLHHGAAIVATDSKVPAVSCQENSKQFLWNAASHFATQGFPQQQGSSAAEPPTKKLRTGGNEKISSPATLLSDENNKKVQNISPFLNGTSGYKPETSVMPNGSKPNLSGLDSILMKSHHAMPPHHGQHSAFISGLDFVSTNHRASEMQNAKKIKKMTKKEAKKRQLTSQVEPPSFVNRSADPNAMYMTDKLTSKDEIKHSYDQNHNLKIPPAVNPLSGDWNRSMDSKEKPSKKGNKGKSYSPIVPVVSHPFVPGSFSGYENNSKDVSTNKPFFQPGIPPSSTVVAASKSWNNSDAPNEHPVLPNTVKSNQHKDKYSNVPSPNLSHSQQSVNAQGSASNPVTLPADNARDNAALLKVFQQLQQGNQPDAKDPKKDYVVRNSNVNSNMTSQLPNTQSSADVAYASSVGENASYNSNQALLAQIMNGNNPSINPDAGNHELALKLLAQHYGTGSNNKSDLNKAQGMSLDLSSTGNNALSQASSDHQQYQELQKQLLFMAQLRSLGANNDRLNGAQAIDNIGADQNAAAMALFQQPLATQLLLSQLGLSGNNDVNQRSMDNGALQQLMQLQQLQHLQQLLQQVEYQQPSLNDRLKQQQSFQHQQLQQQNHLAAQQQQMLTQVRGPPTPQLSAKASGDGSNVFSTLLAQALLQQQQQQQHQGNFSNRSVQSSHFAPQQQVGAPTVAQQQLQQLSQQQQSQIPLHLLAALIQKQNN